MRSEKRKKILVYLMALFLLLSIPAVYLHDAEHGTCLCVCNGSTL